MDKAHHYVVTRGSQPFG